MSQLGNLSRMSTERSTEASLSSALGSRLSARVRCLLTELRSLASSRRSPGLVSPLRSRRPPAQVRPAPHAPTARAQTPTFRCDRSSFLSTCTHGARAAAARAGCPSAPTDQPQAPRIPAAAAARGCVCDGRQCAARSAGSGGGSSSSGRWSAPRIGSGCAAAAQTLAAAARAVGPAAGGGARQRLRGGR